MDAGGTTLSVHEATIARAAETLCRSGLVALFHGVADGPGDRADPSAIQNPYQPYLTKTKKYTQKM